MRLALLSNVTVDMLSAMLGKANDVYLSAGFDTWQQEIINSDSGLYGFKPEAIIILLHADAYSWIKGGTERIDEWCTIISALTVNIPGIPVFVSSLDISPQCHYGSDKRNESFFENYLVERVQAIKSAGVPVYILPVKDLVTEMGRNSFFAPKMWYIGSMPYSLKALSALNGLKAWCAAVHGVTKSQT